LSQVGSSYEDLVTIFIRKIAHLMKLLLLLLFICSASLSFADSSHCYSIQNSDQKNYCLGMSKNDASYCYSIREDGVKNLCLAQVKRDKSYCYSIHSSDMKNQCLGLVK